MALVILTMTVMVTTQTVLAILVIAFVMVGATQATTTTRMLRDPSPRSPRGMGVRSLGCAICILGLGVPGPGNALGDLGALVAPGAL